MFATIVVANDGSDGGFKALELACELAKKHRSARPPNRLLPIRSPLLWHRNSDPHGRPSCDIL